MTWGSNANTAQFVHVAQSAPAGEIELEPLQMMALAVTVRAM